MPHDSAQLVRRRIDALAQISEEPGVLTRTFASPAMRHANALVASWMRRAGMETRVDAVGNLIGHYPASRSEAKILLLGSHLDTVRNAGRFDGPLGVIAAVACVEDLHRQNIRLPFAVEVVGFADEEGVRYQTACLGSRAMAGKLPPKILERKDARGISMRDAIRRFGGNPARLKSARLNPRNLLGYVEVHIEQGPVLEQRGLPVGIVSAISGQTRLRLRFAGRAAHAGTTPMRSRRDALCAASEFIVATERFALATRGLVATVGEIAARPGASNVIPGDVELTLDVRHQKNAVRKSACARLAKMAAHIARKRGVSVRLETIQEIDSVECSSRLSAVLAFSMARRNLEPFALHSGAGHDAAVMAGITSSAMLFVRCRNGVSHHPAEFAATRDIHVAIQVLGDCVRRLGGLL